jgi:peptidylprolyl isomerase
MMTNLMRRLLVVIIALAALVPFTASVAAQDGLDGSACWQPGQLSVSGANMTWTTPPATIIDPAETYSAMLQTTAGTIELALDPASAPIATNNFICLALAGYYTGTDFHRIAAEVLVQGGDPSGTGLGGPGYTVPSDPTTGTYHAGSVAMANAAPNENGSQFFIAAGDLTGRIPADYPVFGHVTSGMDVVRAISQGQVQANPDGEQTKPVDPTVLLNVTIEAGIEPAPTTEAPTVQPAATTVVVPTPTVATGSAQDRPGGTTAGTTAGSGDCAGLEEYESAFDDAYMSAAFANPDALSFLMGLQEGGSQNMFEEMTPEQAEALSAFYFALADSIGQIAPPPFAAEWHQVQIEIFQALGEFTANIATQGLTLASMQVSSRLQELTDRSNTATESAAAVCADFRAWATGEAE